MQNQVHFKPGMTYDHKTLKINMNEETTQNTTNEGVLIAVQNQAVALAREGGHLVRSMAIEERHLSLRVNANGLFRRELVQRCGPIVIGPVEQEPPREFTEGLRDAYT